MVGQERWAIQFTSIYGDSAQKPCSSPGMDFNFSIHWSVRLGLMDNQGRSSQCFEFGGGLALDIARIQSMSTERERKGTHPNLEQQEHSFEQRGVFSVAIKVLGLSGG